MAEHDLRSNSDRSHGPRLHDHGVHGAPSPRVELAQIERRKRRVAGTVALAVVAGIGTWMTAPVGIVLLTRGEGIGWPLAAVGVLLAAACVVAIVGAVRTARSVAIASLPGRANPAFDETAASPDPRPGAAWAGSQWGG